MITTAKQEPSELDPTSTPTATTTTARLFKADQVIPPSSPFPSDGDSDVPLRSTQTLKAVVVPLKVEPQVKDEFKRPLPLQRRYGTSSASTISPISATRDNSLEYDTPATSAAATPISVNSSSIKRSTKATVGKGKGKRALHDALLAVAVVEPRDEPMDDAQLALALQEEEYGVPTSKRQKTSAPRKRRSAVFTMDDVEEADLYDLSELSDYDEDYVRMHSTNPRRKPPPILQSKSRALVPATDVGSTSSSSVPRRRAGAAAKQVVAKKSSESRVVVDSETSDLSDVLSDDDDFLSDLEHFNGISEEEESELSSVASFVMTDGGSVAGGATATSTLSRRRRGRILGDPHLDRAARERKKLEKAHPEIVTMWKDLAAVQKIPVREADQPASINRQLKSFQREGLNWMIEQEKTQWKGGLLGDEMGMGKTIQAVSLIMSDYPAKNPTLVLVPPVALLQWSNEIQAYTDGKLKVLVYHGTNPKARKMTVKQLRQYDVIMISYAGLESVYRKETKGWSRGENIIKEDSAIHAIHYHRLILDEAHSIKSRTTGIAKACFALKGTYKWCLSGTPVQNRIGEFFSLLRFLEVKPFANYFCKACPCSTLHWSVSDDYRCNHCKHSAIQHVSVFNQEILNPISGSDSPVVRKEALNKLRLLTDRIMLRRMKKDYTASMELPPKEVMIHNEFFGEIERDFSSSIMSNTARQFDTYVSRGVMLNNYANIFGLIMQMRQVSDHPDMLLKKHAAEGQNVLVCELCDEVAEDAVRSRCKHEFCRSCVKDYIRSCEGAGGVPDCPRCHIALAIDLDQVEIEQDEENVKKNSIINRIKMENWTSSTKIEMLVYDLYKLRSKKQTLKSIVFSQFTSMLQLIEWRLRRCGFNTGESYIALCVSRSF